MKNIHDLTMSKYDLLSSDEQCKAFESAMKIIDKNIRINEPIIKAVVFFKTEMINYSESDNFVESVRDFIKKHPMSFPSKKSDDQQFFLSDNGFVNTKAEATPIRDNEMVEMVEEWLKENAIKSKRKHKHSSYKLKHDVEADLHTYITNGAFIQACLNLGFKVDRIEGGLNGYIYADFIGINPIKKICKELDIGYEQLSDLIGYGVDAIKKSAASGEISRQMEVAISLLRENMALKAKESKDDQLRKLLKDFIFPKNPTF